jgi:hypothetical protein
VIISLHRALFGAAMIAAIGWTAVVPIVIARPFVDFLVGCHCRQIFRAQFHSIVVGTAGFVIIDLHIVSIIVSDSFGVHAVGFACGAVETLEQAVGGGPVLAPFIIVAVVIAVAVALLGGGGGGSEGTLLKAFTIVIFFSRGDGILPNLADLVVLLIFKRLALVIIVALVHASISVIDASDPSH